MAAYSSYEHQRRFAVAGGAEATAARLWPLSVDGLVLLASIGLLRAGPHATRRSRFTLWLAFGLGIVVSLAANIAAAPALGWQPVLVAGWPPIALLLAVELLAHRTGPEPHASSDRRDTGERGDGVDATQGWRTQQRELCGWGRLSSGCGSTTSANERAAGRRPAPNWTASLAPTTTAAPSSPAGDAPAAHQFQTHDQMTRRTGRRPTRGTVARLLAVPEPRRPGDEGVCRRTA